MCCTLSIAQTRKFVKKFRKKHPTYGVRGTPYVGRIFCIRGIIPTNTIFTITTYTVLEMVFSSVIFLFGYLPLCLLGYYILPLRARGVWLFVLSLAFYGFGEPVYIAVMLLSVTTAYLCGFPIGKYRQTAPQRARRWLALSLSLNLSLLLFFKYTNFFIENFARIPPLADLLSPIEGLTLPIGISFYTFQIMSYSIDLYRGDTDTQKNYVAFGTYVSLFPQLIAGPIVRYRDIDAQLVHRPHSVAQFASGVRRFAVGFAKKALLGDPLAALYAYLGTLTAVENTVPCSWLMVLSYSLHIYFDFSGYSDMAVGLGRMFGFSFPENFNYPYIAASITDFWRRWHISLSTWFREYVYIPLGGNRHGIARQTLNMAAVWLLTGLWHGAAWNFVLWGGFYFVILFLEKIVFLRIFARNRVTRALGHVWALTLVGIGWMLFDHTDIHAAASVIGGLFGVGAVAGGITLPLLAHETLASLPLLTVAVLAATPFPLRLWRAWQRRHPSASGVSASVLAASLFILAVAYTVSGSFSPFLYFNF